MSDYFRNLIKSIGDVDTHIAQDSLHSSEFSGAIDTGSYILNAILTGSLKHGGVPNNKITAFAGETTTGKTFFVLGIIRQFLKDDPTAGVVFYDTEAAVTKGMMEERGIDTSRVIISEQTTVQGFRTHVMRTLDRYIESENRPPIMFVLDSLGQLSTEKEVADIAEGKDTRDMTRAQLLRGTFRALSLKLAKAHTPMLVTNHVYDVIGSYMPMKEMGGGAGLKFAASQIVFLSKKKDKDGTEVVGNIIHCRMNKSRFTKENKVVDVKLSYDTGLDRYYGLLELAEKYEIFKKVSTRYEIPDGTKLFGKQIMANPEKYFTEDIMHQLEIAAETEFKYGKAKVDEIDSPEEGEVFDNG